MSAYQCKISHLFGFLSIILIPCACVSSSSPYCKGCNKLYWLERASQSRKCLCFHQPAEMNLRQTVQQHMALFGHFENLQLH